MEMIHTPWIITLDGVVTGVGILERRRPVFDGAHQAVYRLGLTIKLDSRISRFAERPD
jgi:hypothetical protein